MSGRDLNWFFDQVYRSSAAFDYGIDAFSSSPDVTRGYVGDGDRRRFTGAATGAERFHTVVVVRRYEDGVFPVDVRVVLENGEEIRWRWEGAERWKSFEVDRPVRAVVRPGRSGAHPAARSELYEQLRAPDRRYRSRGRAEVVAHVADLAAGPPPHLRILRLI